MNHKKSILHIAAICLLMVVGMLEPGVAQEISSEKLSAAPIPLHRARWQPSQRRHRNRRSAQRVLCRGRVGRHFQDHGRRYPLASDLRRSAVSSIGALAVAPSDPNIVWAGTGEAWIRSHISVGAGIYKSADAGKSWTLMGLEKTGRIARIVINPTDPNIVLVAALGHAYGPQPERGVFSDDRRWKELGQSALHR
jgi:hypothetical protein